ncbi:MAG: leucine--tRNA ligase, partial [Candidatus Aenigmarchaeota archaeon]|nr:leucine--tRNA ligase [Candidatus Aenigmarchaeota archaeon]
DPAEADISDWNGAQIKDFVILKFRSGDTIFPAATMRPETIFGATNIWVNPKGTYVKAVVDGEKWVIAEDAVKKLEHLGKTVHVHEHVSGKEFLGMKVTNPATEKDIPIIFGDFVSTDEATGVVMSVPAHDPHDFIHLARANPKAKPIKVVDMPGFGEAPAGEMLEKFKIHDFNDAKIETVKKELYKLEFLGKMAENTGKFKGMPVKEAKKAITDWLLSKKEADFIYELSVKPIHCRCGGEVIIKAVKNQWFIDYGNFEWKNKVKKHIIDMNMYPPEYQNELPGIIDWLEGRPCVRRKGLGTKFPFDDKWVIEAISDSTIYMSFFIISKYFNQGKIKMVDLTDRFFDYVLLGKGKALNKTWEKIRKEFIYWYPLDMNCGGKEHKSVHFPFFIYNHVGIFPKKHWPKGIFLNWHLVVYGKKMSKSKGNVVFWKDAIEKYGADAVRLYIAHGSNQWVDFDWKNEEAEVYSNHVKSFYGIADELIKKKSKSNTSLDKWMTSRMNRIIKDATEHMDKYEIRKTIDKAFFSTISDINWYMKRSGKYNLDVLSSWVKMLSPFIPHAAEEVWSKLGNKKSLVNEKWPSYKKSAINLKIEAGEDMIRQIMGDVGHIKKLAKITKPKKISIFVAPRWKYDVYNKAMKGKSMKAIMSEKKYQKIGKYVAGYFNKITKRMPLDKLTFSALDEYKILNNAKDFFKKNYGCSIEIFASGKSKHPKADSANPSKPGILVE